MKWAALTASAVAVLSLGLLGYHRTLPPCFERSGPEAWHPLPGHHQKVIAVYERRSGFFNCR